MRIPDEKTRLKLLEDYSTVSRNLMWIIKRGQNGYITVRDYTTPVARGEELDLDDKRGEYQYYSKLKKIIGAALSGRRTKIRAPCRLPKYLSDLLK